VLQILSLVQSWWSDAGSFFIALVVALAAAWVIYRLQKREERNGVLAALDAELSLYEAWVGGDGYKPGMWARGYSERWWGGPKGAIDKVVYKISTVATDSAIALGPSLFMNRALVRALVNYRQRAQQLNQLIDDMSAFRTDQAALYLPADDHAAIAARDALRAQLDGLAGMVHEGGIGSENTDGANRHYRAVRDALRREQGASRARRWLWFWLSVANDSNGDAAPNRLLLEDGSGFLQLEDGSGVLLLESDGPAVSVSFGDAAGHHKQAG
jgi:hypothetical protein